MLGLTVGTDTGAKIGSVSHKKSYDFASKNIGRFHTLGVSGSMKKHTEKKAKEQLQPQPPDEQDEKLRRLKDRSKSYVPERLEARQREIEEDTMKLLELEKKLDEVKRQKELKRRREEARQQQRLHYSSACVIQRLTRSWLLKRHMRAATVLQSFLKFAAAKQIEIMQQKKKDRLKAARILALKTWATVELRSATSVAEARKCAVLLAARCIQAGTRMAELQKLALIRQRNSKKKNKTSSIGGSPSNTRAANMWALLKNRKIPVLFKFHNKSWVRHRRVFTDGWMNPVTNMEHPDFVAERVGSLAEAAEVVAEQRRRARDEQEKRNKMNEILRLHQQREEEMRQERILRMKIVEEQKIKKEMELKLIEQEEVMRRAIKEKSKLDFLRRLEAEQSERARVVNMVREKKERIRQDKDAQLKLERENEVIENKLMYAEDLRFLENLEKIRRKRLKDIASKRKLELEKAERDHQPGPSQVASGPGYLSARGKVGGTSEHDQAMEEERKMFQWAANEAALKQRLAARRAAEKQEKINAELEQEMIRKEKELVAMKAQLMLKRAAFMKAKALKLKEQAEENSNHHHARQDEGTGRGSTSARGGGSRGGSRGGLRKKNAAGTSGGSGSAPNTSRESQSPTKTKVVSTIYDVTDPLGISDNKMSRDAQRQVDATSEDWGWHTPTAVGSGKSAVSELRRSKYSPILHKKAVDPISISPGAVRLNSAERLALACRRERDDAPQPNGNRLSTEAPLALHDYGALRDDGLQLPSIMAPSPSLRDPFYFQNSPIEVEEKEVTKLPSIVHTASEGRINGKSKNIESRGVLKNKHVNNKLINSPYGSLPTTHGKPAYVSSQKVESENVLQNFVNPTAAFNSMNRPIAPSLQGISIKANKTIKTNKAGSLMEIVEKAREKLRLDKEQIENQEKMSAALTSATLALGGKKNDVDIPDGGAMLHQCQVQPDLLHSNMTAFVPPTKSKKKVKKEKKKIPVSSILPLSEEVIVEKPKEKINKRKLINSTYTKIMKADVEKKAQEAARKKMDEEVNAEVVANFFAMRRKQTEDEIAMQKSRDESKDEEDREDISPYWNALIGTNLSPQRTKKNPLSLAEASPFTKAAMSFVEDPKTKKGTKNKSPTKRQYASQFEDVTENETAYLLHKIDEVHENKLDQKFYSNRLSVADSMLPLHDSPYQQESVDAVGKLQRSTDLEGLQDDCEEEDHSNEADDYYDDNDFEHDDVEHSPIRSELLDMDDYENELNKECERLRAQLEQKMLAKFDV